jgi:tetratricopeptide (TPR) repeat protein
MAVDTTKFIQKAQQAIERRNYDLAIFNYKQAVALNPGNMEARRNLRAAQMKNFSEKGLNPTVATLKAIVPIIKANFFSMQGKHEQTLIACEDALTINPEIVSVMRLIAKVAAEMEEYELACWQLQEILSKYDPEDIDIMYDLIDFLPELGRTGEAVDLCDKIKSINPDEDIQPIILELEAKKTQTVFEKGVKEGARSIVKDEAEARDREVASQIARTDDMRLEQVAAIEKELENRPDDYRIMLRIGDVWLDFEDFARGYKEAKVWYEKAKEIMPSDNNINVKLGDLEIKRMKLSIRGMQVKLKKDPDNAELKAKYAAAVKKFREFRIEEYERRVKAQPLMSIYHLELGKYYFEAKEYDKAVGELQQSRKDPKFAIQSYTIMGQSFAAMGQHETAVDTYKRAIDGQEVFAKIKEPLYYLAEAQEDLGMLDDALENYNRIFEDDISFKDVKNRVPQVREKIKAAKAQ